MARTYVFYIHGVGKQLAGSWGEGWEDGLIAALRKYKPYDKRDPDDIRQNVLRFVPISYDSVFEGYRKRWIDLTGALAASEVVQAGELKDALTWVKDDQDQGVRDAFWTYALDAVLWACLPQARAAVLASVQEQIVRGVLEMIRENQGASRAHWVAHSLGTSVLHDALVSLHYAKDLHEGAFDPANFKWQSVSMVANTSRLLRACKSLSADVPVEQFDPYHSLLKPGEAASLTRSYFNFHHRLDPITWPKQFQPVGFTNGYTDHETQHFRDPKRIHDLAHYIEHPLVHLRMLRSFLGNDALGDADEVKREAESFVQKFPLTGTKPFAELRDVLGDNSENPLSAQDLAKFLSLAFKALKEAT